MTKLDIKKIIIMIIFLFLLIPCVSNATETYTYENFNYHVETVEEYDDTIQANVNKEYVYIDSLIDNSVEEIKIPLTINDIEVKGFVEQKYDYDIGASVHFLTDCKSLKRIIMPNKDISLGLSYNGATNSTVEEIVIEDKVFDSSFEVLPSSFSCFTALKTIKGYGETRLKYLAEKNGYTYVSIGDNDQEFVLDESNSHIAEYLNVIKEEIVVDENIHSINFVKSWLTYYNGISTDEFSKNAANAIKVIKFETKEQLYSKDYTTLTNLEKVYGYKGTGAENIAKNLGVEFISLGEVEEVCPFKYEIVDNSYVKITGVRRTQPTIVEFPEYIEGLPVEVIAKNTIDKYGEGLLAIESNFVIPATVKTVEDGAFDGSNMSTLKVLSKEINYLDDFNFIFRYQEEISSASLVVHAYEGSGMLEVVKSHFGEDNYISHYVELIDKYTNIETEDITVDTETGDTVSVMPITSKTNVDSLLTEENFPVIGTYIVKVLDATKTVVKKDTDKVGSRNVIQIISTDSEGKETVLKEYMAIVNGDINGDGEVKIYDSFQILKGAIKSNTVLDSVEKLIRDSNDDGNVILYDAFQFLKKAIIG